MSSVPIPRTFQAGELETGGFLNALTAVCNWLLSPPRARIHNTASTSAASGAFTQIACGTVDYDTDGMTGTANELTIQTAGTYRITAFVDAGTALGGATRQGSIWRSGNELATWTQGPPPSGQWSKGTLVWEGKCAAGDTFYIAALQDSGSAQPVGSFTDTHKANYIAASWIGT